MDGRQSPVADYPGVQVRRAHSHATPAVDVALTPWPQMAEQRTAIEEMLDTTLLGRICVEQGVAQAAVDITLENVAAGHSWPSGSAQDRRAWLELVAYEGGEVTYSTGVVEEGEPVVGRDDPDLWQFRDYLLGEDGEEVHMFWDATDVVSELIAGSKSFEDDPQHLVPIVGRRFRVPGNPERVTMQVRMRPVGLDVIDDLIESGDLDPIYRATIPTYDLASTKIEWTPELGAVCNPPLD